MAFEYNSIDFDKLESVRVVGGEISPKSGQSDNKNASLTEEQKRKKQLVQFLDSEFAQFHSLLDKLISVYYNSNKRRQRISEILGIPDYVNCSNCVNMRESTNGEPICNATRHEEDGEVLFNIISDSESIPRFCPSDNRYARFPEERLDDAPNWIIEVAKEGYDEEVREQRECIKERRQQAKKDGREHSDYVTEDIEDLVPSETEYASGELDKLIKQLFDPDSFQKYRRSAMRVAWMQQLHSILEEDYYHQRGEAYLRALDSPYRSDTMPGEGGDDFEKKVRDWLVSWGFPMYDRVFELDGVAANHKEMDVHTEIPTGERVVFEVFTRGAHNDKERQLQDYCRLLEQSEDINPAGILLSDGSLTRQRLNESLLWKLMSLDMGEDAGMQPPGTVSSRNWGDPDVESLGFADSLSYSGYKPDYEPVQASQKKESQIVAKLRSMGYDPLYPVYQDGIQYGFCGPTIELGGDENRISLTFHSNRERQRKNGELNDRMFKSSDDFGHEWMMDGVQGWYRGLSEIKDCPVAVVEVTEDSQPKLHPAVLHGLLNE